MFSRFGLVIKADFSIGNHKKHNIFAMQSEKECEKNLAPN